MSNLNDTQKAVAETYDAALLDILVNGETAKDEAGQPIVIEGKAVRATPTAAMMKVIRERLKDLGATAMPVIGTSTGDLVAQAQVRGMKYDGKPIPPLSTEDDAATG